MSHAETRRRKGGAEPVVLPLSTAAEEGRPVLSGVEGGEGEYGTSAFRREVCQFKENRLNRP